jgi:hypothetical protein
MSKNRLLTARKPQPGNFCENTGYYVMVYSYYPGAPRILDKNKIWCVKGRKLPPYRKFVVLPNKQIFLTSKLKCKGYLLLYKTKRLY